MDEFALPIREFGVYLDKGEDSAEDALPRLFSSRKHEHERAILTRRIGLPLGDDILLGSSVATEIPVTASGAATRGAP
jgi:hypothetical protein